MKSNVLIKEIISNDILTNNDHKWIYYSIGYSKLINRIDTCIQEELTDTFVCTIATGVKYNYLQNIGN